MEKNTEQNKTFIENVKEKYGTYFTFAGIAVVVLLFLWIPFKVIPMILGNSTKIVATTLTSMLIPSESSSTSKTSTVTTNDTTSTKTTENTETTKPESINTVVVQPSYYGKPDLQITLVGTGILDPATKQFVSTNYAGFNNDIAIKFEVQNIGSNISGPWKLRINTPSRTTPYYDSPEQVSIKPNDRMVFTASYDSPLNTGINTTYITVDPLDAVDESSESNNQLVVQNNVEGTSYTYDNNYNYGTVTVNPYTPYGTTYSWTNMKVSCYANPQTAYRGNPVTWYVNATGGNGYFTYTWTGSDQLYSSNNVVEKTYFTSGQKIAIVNVVSNGTPLTAQCTTYIY